MAPHTSSRTSWVETGRFLLLWNFSITISGSPYVYFILVLILISMILRYYTYKLRIFLANRTAKCLMNHRNTKGEGLSTTNRLKHPPLVVVLCVDCASLFCLLLIYSRLSLSRSGRDPLKYFEISILRHTRFAELRQIPIEQPNFTNKHVI